MTDKELIEEASLYDPKTGLMGEPGSQTRTLCELVTRLAAAVAAHQWRPIETAPRDGTEVLIGWAGSSYQYSAKWAQDYECRMSRGDGWLVYDCEDYWYSLIFYKNEADFPTHWKPATPPEAGE